ncbi:hypothetical protein I656_01795 [Geobacillus sp. WSUCF1]|nr:hypothetical protein I656_01795 [Geobacillus sp. WSUCF1]
MTPFFLPPSLYCYITLFIFTILLYNRKTKVQAFF